MPSADIYGPAVLSVTQGIGAFNQFLPKLADVRKADPVNNPDVAADVRIGEIAAVTLTLGVSAIASSLTQSPLPVFTGLVVCFILVFLYESTLKAERPFEPKPRLRVVTTEEGA